MKLVIVESPAKAKTINKYLGSDFKVLASYGHVRSLPSKTGSVNPDEDFSLAYELTDKADKHVKELIKSAQASKEIFLATDPDREGEAISWHIAEILKDKISAKKNIVFNRISFNEITKKSVQTALASPREIDIDLVRAQQARQALDYLVGFNLSPVLWTKIPGCRSAGRVQSVSLKLICEREYEIEKFISQEYWDITIEFLYKRSKIKAKLTTIDGKKLEKFTINNEIQAQGIEAKVKLCNFKVLAVEEKEQRRNPPSPFNTSLLQQEASRKLGFGTKKIMQLAQKLYEGVSIDGDNVALITYMRTDGVTIADDAITSIRGTILKEYGKEYLPSSPRVYKTKTKNAQEAHEAIRPVDINIFPKSVEQKIDKDLYRLYNLIWQRTISCQMESAIIDMVSIDIKSTDNQFIARANGHTIKFDGFYKIYSESSEDEDSGDDEEGEKKLPILDVGQALDQNSVSPNQHFTEPPPRYSEASLVKKMVELGIGRPSTYATIISVLQDRNYVKLDKKRFIPEDHGRIVTAFLQHYFAKYLEYDFTATLENELDEVSAGKLDWKELLHKFWQGFNANVVDVKQYKITDIIETLDKDLEDYLFPVTANHDKPRSCTKCEGGNLNLRFGKFGPFIACSNYPTCSYSRKLSASSDEDGGEQSNMIVGVIDDQNVYLRKGPYGSYLQLGEMVEGKKPKRVSLPPSYKPENITMEVASWLLSLPKFIGTYNDNEILLNLGRFGFYLKYQEYFVSIGKDDPNNISLARAIELIEAKMKNPKTIAKTFSKKVEAPVAAKPKAKKPAAKVVKAKLSVGKKAEDVIAKAKKKTKEKASE